MGALGNNKSEILYGSMNKIIRDVWRSIWLIRGEQPAQREVEIIKTIIS